MISEIFLFDMICTCFLEMKFMKTRPFYIWYSRRVGSWGRSGFGMHSVCMRHLATPNVRIERLSVRFDYSTIHFDIIRL
jgi:hypothetical protein